MSACIASIYICLKFAENKYNKSEFTLCEILKEGGIVYCSSLLGLYIFINYLMTTKQATEVFTQSPDF